MPRVLNALLFDDQEELARLRQMCADHDAWKAQQLKEFDEAEDSCKVVGKCKPPEFSLDG